MRSKNPQAVIGIVLAILTVAGCSLRPAPPRGAGPSATVHAAEPPKQLPVPKAPEAVPILMYHVIESPPPATPWPGLYVAPQDFYQQVHFLTSRGYRAITLEELFAAWRSEGTLPAHPIVLTFDDGYQSVFTRAYPVLRELGWPGVLFLQVGMLGKPGGLTAQMVQALAAAGWEVDAHTLTHPDLTRLGPERLRAEVAGSRERIQELFHAPADFFAYPAGRYNAAVLAAVRAAGFRGAVTTDYGLAIPTEPYTLKRIRVSGDDHLAGFAAKVRAWEAVEARQT